METSASKNQPRIAIIPGSEADYTAWDGSVLLGAVVRFTDDEYGTGGWWRALRPAQDASLERFATPEHAAAWLQMVAR